MRKGAFDLDDLAEQLNQMQKLGGMGGVLGMLPGVGKIKKQLDTAKLDDAHPEAPAGDHRLDDEERAQEPEGAQCLAQEARGGGLGHLGAGHQQAREDAPADGRHDEVHGQEARAAWANCSAAVRRQSFPPICRPARRCLPACLRSRQEGFPALAAACRAAFPASQACPAAFPACPDRRNAEFWNTTREGS